MRQERLKLSSCSRYEITERYLRISRAFLNSALGKYDFPCKPAMPTAVPELDAKSSGEFPQPETRVPEEGQAARRTSSARRGSDEQMFGVE